MLLKRGWAGFLRKRFQTKIFKKFFSDILGWCQFVSIKDPSVRKKRTFTDICILIPTLPYITTHGHTSFHTCLHGHTAPHIRPYQHTPTYTVTHLPTSYDTSTHYPTLPHVIAHRLTAPHIALHAPTPAHSPTHRHTQADISPICLHGHTLRLAQSLLASFEFRVWHTVCMF